MSKSSIYEIGWMNLVFENRNKEYGAFQLRQENGKTSFMAFVVGLSLCALLFTIPKVLLSFNLGDTSPVENNIDEIPIVPPIDVVHLNLVEKPPVVKSNSQPPVEQIAPEVLKTPSMLHPIIVSSTLATPDIPRNVDVLPTIISSEGTGVASAYPSTETGPSSGTGTITGAGSDYGNKVVTAAILDKQPAFPGGIEKFYNYVGRNFEAPEINNEKMVRIIVSFIVEKDGSMTDIQVKNDPGYGLGKEAIRVLKSLKTRWSPGIIDSQAVRTAYTLPISVMMN
ncbi:energy transducer TonB [Flavobacterium sp.]|uniref:energy transducer TonB n=1 Tax=Flavobacterium sp. TaxID=239 RepID=UPI003C5FB760